MSAKRNGRETGEERALVAPYRTLLPDDARQRRSPLRKVFNALRWLAAADQLPTRAHRLPADAALDQAGCCAALVNARRLLLRTLAGRAG